MLARTSGQYSFGRAPWKGLGPPGSWYPGMNMVLAKVVSIHMSEA